MVETIIFILQPILKSKNKLFFFSSTLQFWERKAWASAAQLLSGPIHFVLCSHLMNSLPCGKRKSTISQKAASIELWNLHNTPSIFTKENLLLLFASKYYHQIPSRRKRVANQQISFFNRIYFQDEETFFAAPLNFGNNLASIWYWSWQHWMAWVRKSKQELIMKSGILRDAAASNSLAFRENDGKEGSLLLAHSDLLVDDIARSKIPCSLPFMQ